MVPIHLKQIETINTIIFDDVGQANYNFERWKGPTHYLQWKQTKNMVCLLIWIFAIIRDT